MGKFIDLTGQRFGRLIVKEKTDKKYQGNIQWKCICDCGKERLASSSQLKRTNKPVRSCGCMRGSSEDLIGKNFGRLTVLNSIEKRAKNGAKIWECKCQCGNTKHVSTGELKRGDVKSCGCLSSDVGKEMCKSNDIVNIGRYKQTKIPQLKQKTSIKNTSGCKGVSWRNDINKWNAYINMQGKHYALGVYELLEDATKARRIAEEELFQPIIEEYNRQKEE